MRFIGLFCVLLIAHSVASASPHPAQGTEMSTRHFSGEHSVHQQGDGARVGATVRSGKVSCDCKGRVQTRIDDNGRAEEYIYHPRTGKLILILNEGKRSAFHYNDGGKLIRAENSDGQIINIAYNDRGLVRTINEVNFGAGSMRTLHFKYKASDKPTEIHLIGVGRVIVTYGVDGEIAGVSAEGGTKMAIEVARALQVLKSVLSNGGLK